MKYIGDYVTILASKYLTTENLTPPSKKCERDKPNAVKTIQQ